MSNLAESKLVVHYGLDGTIRIDERSLHQSTKVREQLEAARIMAKRLGLLPQSTNQDKSASPK